MTDEPWAQEQKRLGHKATVGELANKLQVGTFTPLLLPSQELLARASTAAQRHFLPPVDDCRQEGDKALAQGLLQLMRSGVAAMLRLPRVLNEMAIALDWVASSPLARANAERVAPAYAGSCRKLLYEASLNKPLRPELDPSSFEESMAVFLRRDLHSETRELLGIGPQSGLDKNLPPSAVDKDKALDKCFCLYAMGSSQCPNQDTKKKCAFLHSCQFCSGKQCNNAPGWSCCRKRKV